MADVEKETLDKRLEKVGSQFCNVMVEAEVRHMEKVIEDWKKGDVHEMARDLESLSFLHDVASKICLREEGKS
jgi:hypothetical protein